MTRSRPAAVRRPGRRHAFRDWYDYNFMTHVLTPRTQTYVVVTGSRNAFKVALRHDEARTSGFPSVAWSAL